MILRFMADALLAKNSVPLPDTPTLPPWYDFAGAGLIALLVAKMWKNPMMRIIMVVLATICVILILVKIGAISFSGGNLHQTSRGSKCC